MTSLARRRRWNVCLEVFLGCTLLIVASGCSDGDDDGAGSSTTTASVTTTTERTTTTTASTSTSTSSTLASAPVFPEARLTLEHGGPAWAVVLAGSSDFDDSALVTAREAAHEAGYTAGPTDCDDGAAESLGLPGDQGIYTVSVYFGSQAHAEQALTAFRARGVSGAVAEVRTYCGD